MSTLRTHINTAGLFVAGCLLFTCTQAQEPEVFNLGRFRCYTGGFTLTSDDKTIFTTQTHKSAPEASLRLKIFASTWRNNEWSPLQLLNFNDYHLLGPVLSNNGERLYFSSTAPAPGKTEEGDVNIWFVERMGSTWGAPVFADALNSAEGDRISFIDNSGTVYLVSSRAGNLDVYTSRVVNNSFTTPEPIRVWNTPDDEEYVSLNGSVSVAFLQRTKQNETTEILWSKLDAGEWTSPVPLAYKDKSTPIPYVHKWPRLSNDQSTFYLISHGLIYGFPFKTILSSNAIGISEKNVSAYKPLKVGARQRAEPEPFGGLTLKTNNGIAFSPDGRTAYLSRYTMQRDTAGGQYIKIFESTATKTGWSSPKQVSFMNEQAPYEYHPVLMPDGKRLFYNSRAAKPGSGVAFLSANNLWTVERLANGTYSQPEMLDVLATDNYDDYASATRNGTLYFRSDRPGGKGHGDIYRSALVNGAYQVPENVAALNSEDNENDVCIDPNERFIIFNRYIDATKEIKLFLSVRAGGDWSTPRVIDVLEKETDWELTPSLSPDGKYFFYEVNSNILRVPVAELFTPEEKRAIENG